MSKQESFGIRSLRWLQNKLVHTITVPQHPFEDLNLDIDRPMVYVLKTASFSDLNVLLNISKDLGLPSPFEDLEINGQRFSRVVCLEEAKPLFGKRQANDQFLTTFSDLLSLHQQDPSLDVQLVPVSLFWGRVPGKDDDTVKAAVLEREDPTWLRKALMILFLGRHNFIQFANAVSFRYMANEHGADDIIAHKLARVARVHFHRQRKVMTGPALPHRPTLFKALLEAESIQKAIAEEAAQKNISEQAAREKAISYMDEIAANYSDSLVRISERLLTLMWNKLYKGINIKGAEQIRQLHHDGHGIVYVPCHRSHMDYLLLSYILYFQGMVPPHIAAGINLNFWPAGPMLRRGGAFFIRRSFNGNKLYTAVFKEYLDQLFTKGYSVEYFTEGGRSRTGRLLVPKTGMLAMTLSSVLRGIERPVTLVPVYLGYDHVMEVATYHKELSGQKKEKESIWQVFGAIRKLSNFGQGYVNFGKPITIQPYLNKVQPDWREQMRAEPDHKPSWLTPTVNDIANQVMKGINNAAAVSSITLTSSVLLAAEKNALDRSQLERQLDFYLELLKGVAYSKYTSVVQGTGSQLVDEGLELKKLLQEEDELGRIVRIDPIHTLAMTYYRNNIIHLLIIPAFIANILVQHNQVTRGLIMARLQEFYPLLETELFMDIDDLELYVEQTLAQFVQAELIDSVDTLVVNTDKLAMLELLANIVSETMQRYAILFNLLHYKPELDRAAVEQESHVLAQRLGALHGITAPEFYDKKLYNTLSLCLKEQNYLSDNRDLQVIAELCEACNDLLRPTIRQTIIDAVVQSIESEPSIEAEQSVDIEQKS